MRSMTPIIEIGLPDLDLDKIEQLAEECEQETSNYILNNIPAKSIDALVVSCSFDMGEQLDVEIVIEIDLKYDTGINPDEVIENASEFGTNWLQKRLMEMKVG